MNSLVSRLATCMRGANDNCIQKTASVAKIDCIGANLQSKKSGKKHGGEEIFGIEAYFSDLSAKTW